MLKKEYVDYSEEYRRRKDYMEKQIEHNSKIEGFEKSSINSLILEILTKLTCKDLKNERYIDEMLTETIHQYIQDLEVLYKIKETL